MDSELLALMDQLEALVQSGSKVPLSSRVMINPADAYRLLDQMRQTLPREIVRAHHLVQEHDRIIQEAQIEADALCGSARTEREALIADHAITVEAVRHSEQIKREARATCDRLRLDADAYALHSLRDLQVQIVQTRIALDATLKTVIGGVEVLEGRAARTTATMHPSPIPENP